MRTFPFVPRSNRFLEPGDYWAVPLIDGRFACGRVLQVTGEMLLPTPTRAFFGGLMDLVGDTEPSAHDVARAKVLDCGAMHVKAIQETGGAILGNCPLSENAEEIPIQLCRHGGPGTQVLRGVQIVRPARKAEWGKLPVLGYWAYGVIEKLAEVRFAG